MGDSVKKYFESTSTSDIKTIYPGDIQVTVDKPKKDTMNDLLVSILANDFNISKREVKDIQHLLGKDLFINVLQKRGIDEKQIKKLLK